MQAEEMKDEKERNGKGQKVQLSGKWKCVMKWNVDVNVKVKV